MDFWPTNSPELNPVDCQIKATMQKRIYQTRIHSIDELKPQLIRFWCSLDQNVVDIRLLASVQKTLSILDRTYSAQRFSIFS